MPKILLTICCFLAMAVPAQAGVPYPYDLNLPDGTNRWASVILPTSINEPTWYSARCFYLDGRISCLLTVQWDHATYRRKATAMLLYNCVNKPGLVKQRLIGRRARVHLNNGTEPGGMECIVKGRIYP